MKTCGRCRVRLTDKNANKVFTGEQAGEFQSYCRGCRAVYQKEWCRKNSDSWKRIYRRWTAKPENKEKMKKSQTLRREKSPETRRKTERQSKLKKAYGLSLQEFNNHLEAQGGVCRVCKKSIRGTQKIKQTARVNAHVDHDHTSGKIRGLLCSKCNTGLGLFDDSPSRLRDAAAYLEATA